MWSALKPFLPPRGRLRFGVLGLGSFLGSLAESFVLVLMTLAAEALVRGADVIEVAGRGVNSTSAIGVALALVAVRLLLAFATAHTSASLSADVMATAQTDLLDAYLSTTHAVRSSRPPGDLSAVMLNHARITGDLANAYTTVATGLCGLLAFGATSLAINPVAFLVIAATGGVLMGFMRPLRRRSRAAARAFEGTIRSVSREVTQVERLHREIRVFRVEGPVEARLEAEMAETSQRYRTVRFLGATVPQVFQSTVMAAAVLGLFAMLRSAPTGTDLATAGAIVLLLIRSMSAAQQLVIGNQRVLEFGSYAKGLGELIDRLGEDRVTSGSTTPATLLPIELRQVSFGYDETSSIFENLELVFRAGDVVGIVGPSGAGKSTLVELLLHLRQPTQGSVNFGGVRVDELDPKEFASRIAIVPQDAVLIDGTVAENVAFFRPLSLSSIRAALLGADLEQQVEALPDGIDTFLGADERTLSGGQRQRLTIARALAGNPEVLVLDEPTSALDAYSDEAIADAISRLGDERVTIVVAHRFSTLRSCNRILVIDDGRVQFDGGPDEVAEQSEFFRSMLGAERPSTMQTESGR